MAKLRSTLSHAEYPFERIEEYSENGEPLEVSIPGLPDAKVRNGKHIWQRFADFMPFSCMDESYSLGEGNTPLTSAPRRLCGFSGVTNLLLKNETQNPTWSFKDRGSLACLFMAREMNESITATVSTGNMGDSISAYAARAGITAIVFVPEIASTEKILAMTMHGATVIRVAAPDYSLMKKALLALAPELKLRIVTGNGPVRVEGYKLTAFEMFEQLNGTVPDYIAVPTSACGHIRGLFKGYRELMAAGLADRLPKMIVVQAKNNSPLPTAIKEGRDDIVPFTDVHTIASAISTGSPMGGREIVLKAREYGWPAEDVAEAEILESQRELARSGYFVEPAAATTLFAVRKLRQARRIDDDATVVLMLTGCGFKDMGPIKQTTPPVVESSMDTVRQDLARLLCPARRSFE